MIPVRYYYCIVYISQNRQNSINFSENAVFVIFGLGRWTPAGRSKEPNLTVANLVPGQEYTFRVSAVNSEGESEPLVADHSIIAKNPFGKVIYMYIFQPFITQRFHNVNEDRQELK